jgi:hypothetical protein
MKRTIMAVMLTLSASVASAQEVYIVPRQEGVISRLFRMQQESDAAARQRAAITPWQARAYSPRSGRGASPPPRLQVS